MAVDDRAGNGNGQIEPGEVVEITARVVNTSEGAAEDVTATIQAGANVFLGGRERGQLREQLGDLPPGGYADVTFEAFCNSRAETFPVTLATTTGSGEGNLSATDLDLALGRTFQQPQSLVVKADPEAATPTDAPSLSVDIWQDLPDTSMDRPNAVAVVIGIRDYPDPDIPSVDYALRDATLMRRYLTEVMGFRPENVIVAENASGATLTRLFGTAADPKGQLYNFLKPGVSDVFVYYSGHGAPDPETERAFLVASDTDPDYLTLNGYPVDQLYANLAELPARSVTVILEACFSGVSEAGAVVQNISPSVLSVENPVMALENGLAITAGAANQVSTWYPEKKHGLFTYFFLKGLGGEADWDGDRAITARELEAYLTERVPYRARRMHNREQTPQVTGSDLDRVLVRLGGQ